MFTVDCVRCFGEERLVYCRNKRIGNFYFLRLHGSWSRFSSNYWDGSAHPNSSTIRYYSANYWLLFQWKQMIILVDVFSMHSQSVPVNIVCLQNTSFLFSGAILQSPNWFTTNNMKTYSYIPGHVVVSEISWVHKCMQSVRFLHFWEAAVRYEARHCYLQVSDLFLFIWF